MFTHVHKNSYEKGEIICLLWTDVCSKAWDENKKSECCNDT